MRQIIFAVTFVPEIMSLIVLPKATVKLNRKLTVGSQLALATANCTNLPHGDPTHGMLPLFYLPSRMVGIGFGVALAFGVASGLIPAITAMRLRVVDALRRV